MALRFITKEQMSELINLYHLSKVALSGTGKRSTYDQMLWATREFNKLHPEVSASAAYKDLIDLWKSGEGDWQVFDARARM